MRRLIYSLLLVLLLVCCSKMPQINSSSETVAIDFACDKIAAQSQDSESFMFTLVGESNSGEPLSDVYSYDNGTLTSASKMLAANNETYNLVIASPATKMEAIDGENPETSAYGYKVERTSPVQPYVNVTPITVAVDGILANHKYIYDLGNVTLQEQRSKVKVQFRVLSENDPRTITKLYYSNVYDAAYTSHNSGLQYGDNKPDNNAYDFAAFSADGTGSKTYSNTKSEVEPTVTPDEEDVAYFISGDYSLRTKVDAPKLCIGLQEDGEERLIEMGLNIKMKPMTVYTYDIKISSTELTVRVTSTDVWDSTGIEGEVGEGVGSFTINIATGVVSDWEFGSDEDGLVQPPADPDPIKEVDYTKRESSNCYILNPSQDKTMVYYIPVERINEFWGDAEYVAGGEGNILSNVGDNWEAVMFWHDFSNPSSADAISNLTIEKSFGSETGKAAVKVTLPKEFYNPVNHCNVGYVVRKIDTKEVLWSWHLWITDYDPYQTPIVDATRPDNVFYVGNDQLHRYDSDIFTDGIYADKKIMDRNIGARSASSGTQEYLGALYYQYGRKDPFPPVALYANGYVYSTDGSSSTQQSFEYAVNNPEKYIIKGGNWCNSGAAQSTKYIWNDYKIKAENYTSGKSIFDPSPLGFRVPINGTWNDFTQTNFYRTPFSGGREYNGYALYPTLGGRNSYSGNLDYKDKGYSWSATPASDVNGYSLSFGPTFVSKSSGNNRALGYCVRPVED